MDRSGAVIALDYFEVCVCVGVVRSSGVGVAVVVLVHRVSVVACKGPCRCAASSESDGAISAASVLRLCAGAGPCRRLCCLAVYWYCLLLLLMGRLQDRDLWRHALRDSDAFQSGLLSLSLDFDFAARPGLVDTVHAWRRVCTYIPSATRAQLSGLSAETLIRRGRPLVAKRKKQVEASVATRVRLR